MRKTCGKLGKLRFAIVSGRFFVYNINSCCFVWSGFHHRSKRIRAGRVDSSDRLDIGFPPKMQVAPSVLLLKEILSARRRAERAA